MLARFLCFAIAALALAGCGGSKHAASKHLVISYRVPSPSMVPTYRLNQHVTVDIEAYKHASPQRGDVIVFHPPLGATNGKECGVPSEPADGHPCAKPTSQVAVGMSFIKRIVAVGGDQVKIVRNGTFIGGRAQSEPFVNKSSPCADPLCNLPRTITIPPGYFFVLGDNRGESDDSRDWGPIPQSSIVGRVSPPG